MTGPIQKHDLILAQIAEQTLEIAKHGNSACAESFISSIWDGLWHFPEKIKVCDWSEREIVLPSIASPQSGQYQVSRTPWSREVMNSWSDDNIEFTVFMSSAQATKTQSMTNCLGYSVEQEDSNILVCFPSESASEGFSTERWQPIVDASPALARLKPKDRHKFKNATQFFNNGKVLNFVNAGSATKLSSRPAGRIFADEIDKYIDRKGAGKEAPSLDLLLQRVKAYKMLGQVVKVFLASTPTLDTGQIWLWYIRGTMEEYSIECVHCEDYFYPNWRENVVFPKEGDDESRGEAAYLQCPHCQGHIDDRQRRIGSKKGKWIQTNPNPDKKIRSFRFNEIISVPELSELVKKFLHAKRQMDEFSNPGPMQDFINSSLGEVWFNHAGRSRSYDNMWNNVTGNRKGVVPENTIALTAGIDTQKNGFYYSVRAWTIEDAVIIDYDDDGNEVEREVKRRVSHVIRNGFVNTFKDVKRIIVDDFYYTKNRKKKFKIELALMDSGGTRDAGAEVSRTQEVYRFCAQNYPTILATRGMRGVSHRPYFETMATVDGFDLPTLNVNTIMFKDTLAISMKVEPGVDSCVYYHHDIEEDFFKQVTAEYKDLDGKWKCPKGKDNHYFDTEVLNLVAADIRGIYHRELEEELEDEKEVNINKKAKSEVGTFGITLDY